MFWIMIDAIDELEKLGFIAEKLGATNSVDVGLGGKISRCGGEEEGDAIAEEKKKLKIKRKKMKIESQRKEDRKVVKQRGE